MSKTSSRRGFLGASAAAVSSLANPGMAAAQGVGVKPADLPDLTIKEGRVYNIDGGRGSTQIAGIVTNSGIEGNYSLAASYWHPNWSNQGWLEYAKRTLLALAEQRPLGVPQLEQPGLAGVRQADAARQERARSAGADFAMETGVAPPRSTLLRVGIAVQISRLTAGRSGGSRLLVRG